MLAYDNHVIAFLLSFTTYVWIPKQYDTVFLFLNCILWSFLFNIFRMQLTHFIACMCSSFSVISLCKYIVYPFYC